MNNIWSFIETIDRLLKQLINYWNNRLLTRLNRYWHNLSFIETIYRYWSNWSICLLKQLIVYWTYIYWSNRRVIGTTWSIIKVIDRLLKHLINYWKIRRVNWNNFQLVSKWPFIETFEQLLKHLIIYWNNWINWNIWTVIEVDLIIYWNNWSISKVIERLLKYLINFIETTNRLLTHLNRYWIN